MKSLKRAWATTVLKAHGYRPVWIHGSLAPASRAQLDVIDLHFHDLRHEGASRLLEAGWPLHHVQEMLGHCSIQQTSTYLNVTATGLQASMRKSDAARIRCNPVAISTTVEQPLDSNGDDQSDGKSLLH